MSKKRRGRRSIRAPHSGVLTSQPPPMSLQSLRFPSIAMDRPPTYIFADKTLEKRVFTHKSAGIEQNSWQTFFASGPMVGGRQDNEHLEFLGDSILKGLTAHLIDSLFPEMDEGRMSILMAALVNNRFYAQLSRTLCLDKRLVIAESTCRNPLESERVLGGLFEAYVGGMHQEMGIERHKELYSWFRQLMEPYALDFFRQMQGTSAQQLRNTQPQQTVWEEEDRYTGDVSMFTSQLHDYVAKYRLAAPEFTFIKRGFEHDPRWICEVRLGERPVMGPAAAAKSAAKHLACRRAMAMVRQRAGQWD